jgi:hypothetical protein
MTYDDLFNVFRQGVQWGLFIGLLAWLFGYGVNYTVKIFKHI